MLIEIEGLDLLVDGLHLLEGFDLFMETGQRLAITGPSGSGKSTLFRALAERSLNKMSAADHWRICDSIKLSYVPQLGGLFPWFDVGNNIERIRLSAPQYMQDVELMEYVNAFGLADLYGSYPYQLSGGERQRLSIILGLVTLPDLLILDEPLTGVDAKIKWRCLEAISRFLSQRGSALILASHDVDVMAYLCDKVFVIGGKPASVAHVLDFDASHPRIKEELFSSAISLKRDELLKIVMGNK